MSEDTLIEACRLLLEIPRSTSFKVAGERLGFDKAKVSRLLALLEKRTGRTLADRTTKPAHLTPEAYALLPDCLDLLETVRRLETPQPQVPLTRATPSHSIEKTRRTLRVSLASNNAIAPMLNLFAQFEERHNVHIDVLMNCGIKGLLQNKADLAWFGFVPDPRFGLTVFPNGQCYSFLMASRNYIKRVGAPKSIEDLKNHWVLMRDTSNGSFEATLECGEKRVVLGEGFRIRQENADVCRERLLAGEGIAMDLTTSFVMNELASGAVVPVLKNWHRPPWNRTLATLPSLAKDPLLLELVDTIVHYANSSGGMNDWRFWYRRFGLAIPENPRCISQIAPQKTRLE